MAGFLMDDDGGPVGTGTLIYNIAHAYRDDSGDKDPAAVDVAVLEGDEAAGGATTRSPSRTTASSRPQNPSDFRP